MQNEFHALNLLIDLKKAKGLNAKKNIVLENSKFKPFTKLLFYCLNPSLTYKVSKRFLYADYCFFETKSEENDVLNACQALFVNTMLDEVVDSPTFKLDELFYILDYMNSKVSLSNFNKQIIKNNIIKIFPKSYHSLIDEILSKTIRLGINAKSVNKIIPNLIPLWEVQQAFPINKYPVPSSNTSEFYLTEKLNGVRCTFYKGDLLSRTGKRFAGLNHIVDVLKRFADDYVFDGELTLVDKNNMTDNEAFRLASGIINSGVSSEQEVKELIKFTIFDVISVDSFENPINPMETYSQRRIILEMLSSIAEFQSKFVDFIPILYKGVDEKIIDELSLKIFDEGKEGLILNYSDSLYKRKRHNGILKIKEFYTDDLEIIGYEKGDSKFSHCLGALIVDYKGNKISVGSGMSIEEREDFWRNRDSLIGRICEIKYKDVSYNSKSKKYSLQFPVFLRMREDKSEVNYESGSISR